MSNLTDALKVDYPEDVSRIKQSIALLSRFSDLEVEALWEDYSRSMCAGWLNVDEDSLQSFKYWIED